MSVVFKDLTDRGSLKPARNTENKDWRILTLRLGIVHTKTAPAVKNLASTYILSLLLLVFSFLVIRKSWKILSCTEIVVHAICSILYKYATKQVLECVTDVSRFDCSDNNLRDY